ncbi:site-specific recombinase XerD [Halovivax ruber XH-70]|uniref:Site-specific recombinase XerD n=1 Tax=Halovivax ruber (strain DSM 18193 / JCM 13892 / XH-70) TaxID=797302 RepID=L0ICY2_HALRX|nr:site-specific integrase [Halovivax ruber]AGB16629.1 site-specific recombinase XerD [Halovivax ruber XH-70]
MSELEPLSPLEALELWLERLQSTRSEATIESYRYRMQSFVEWCDEEEIDNLNDLTSRDVFRYDSERRSEGLSPATLKTQLGTLKLFLEFCDRLEAVPEGLYEKVEVPTVELAERVNDELVRAERAEQILEDLELYDRASRRHAIFAIAWHCGCRLGGLRALDLEDCFFEPSDLDRLRHQDDIDHEALEEVDLPFLYFRHRPETDTPLKNKKQGERPVALSDDVASLIKSYIQVKRAKRSDGDRRPLFTTEKGDNARVSKSSIRRDIYILTQPCRYGTCPHNRDEENCEALKHGHEARCPSSRSPHPIRTGAITHMRDEGWPPEVVAERVNATPEVIRAHYDHPDPIRRMQSRRSFLNKEADT